MTTFSSFAAKAFPALAVLGLGLAGCQADIDAPSASAGSADFSRYIAVGNSLTAGYADNGLYLEGQLNSYPSMLAQQFAQAGGGTFTQPLFTTAQSNGSGYLRLAGFTAAGAPITAAVTTNLAVRGGTATAPLYTKYTDAINNLGVPGIKLADIQTVGYGSTQGNPYFERITPDAAAGQTYFQRVKAEAATATFFSCWLGNNDVLGYATAGGAVASSGITRTDTFNLKAVRIINALTASGAKGVVSNIPDVTGIPFFTTVGPSARASFAAANVPTAAPFVYTTGILAPGAANTRVTTATLASIRNAAGGTLLLTLTASPYIGLYGQPTGRYWRDFYRQATGSAPTGAVFGGFLTALGVDTTRAFGQSVLNPFPSTLVLDPTEQANVATATTAFNSSLRAAATAKGLAFFDANAFFGSLASGTSTYNGVNNSTSFITGNLFSLDGVHPTPRGYALVANGIIRAINTTYGSTVQPVNPTNYRGVLLP
ncbi:SGNH/GDSL hydrolase family protein [Hymenobacter bucti]|uniref:SGNH/GDSL hydrolase family protein n=1 Tax=Hymenobacter bucti TaxID=1844114 RepID=A0ABW4QMR1_9BACT